MGSSVSTAAGLAVGTVTAVQTVMAASAAVTAAAQVAAPLALGLAAAAATGAAAGWSFDETPASAGSSGTATATPWSTGLAAGNKATRDAVHGVFVAINAAKEAASSYVYALSSAASLIAAKAYDKVKRAAANVRRRVVALTKRLYGVAAAASVKAKLQSVDGSIGAGDASSLVESIVHGISVGPSSAIVPVKSSGPLVVLESAAERLARSSADEMMSLLKIIPSVEKKVGLKIPVLAKVAIGVIAVVAELCLAVSSPTMLATASIAASI